jgi:hypothetical protein
VSGDVSGVAEGGVGDVAAFERHSILCRLRAHALVQGGVAGECGGDVPRHLQIAGSADGVPFMLGDDADEIAAPQHARRDAAD